MQANETFTVSTKDEQYLAEPGYLAAIQPALDDSQLDTFKGIQHAPVYLFGSTGEASPFTGVFITKHYADSHIGKGTSVSRDEYAEHIAGLMSEVCERVMA